MIYQVGSKNEWLLLSVTFTVKLELDLVLTFGNAFPWSFHFKANRKSMVSSKKRYLALRLKDRHVFMWQSVKVSNDFNTLKQIFWNKFSGKRKPFFEKLEHRFLVETTETENTSFPFTTGLSETIINTNRMATTKSKSGVLSVTNLFFGKFFAVLEPLKKG